MRANASTALTPKRILCVLWCMVDMVLTIFASSGAAQKQGRAVRSTMTVKRPSRALRIGPASGPQAAQLQSSAELCRAPRSPEEKEFCGSFGMHCGTCNRSDPMFVR